MCAKTRPQTDLFMEIDQIDDKLTNNLSNKVTEWHISKEFAVVENFTHAGGGE